MILGAPLFLLLAGLALPVTALYILKVKRRRVAVPYLRLWEELVVETRARSLFQRLRRLLSLLLQLLILASLVLALTEPDLQLASVKRESIVLLLDTSASMNTVEDPATGETRFDRMLERAREFVEGRSHEDEMLLATVSDRVDVLSSFNRNTLRLRDALQGATPTLRELDPAAGLDFARAVTRDREHPVVLFLSDGAGGAVREALDPGREEGLVTLGEATENLAVTRFAARKNTSLGTDYVLAVVQNLGDLPAHARVELLQDGDPRKVLDVELEPGGEYVFSENFTFDHGVEVQGVLVDRDITLEFVVTRRDEEGRAVPDALAEDDRAWAIVRPTRLRKVVLVAEDAERATPVWLVMEAMAELLSQESLATTPAGYARLSPEERRADVTVCVDALPQDLPEQGNLVLLNTDLPDFLPARQVGLEPAPAVWDWDREHLLNRYMNWRDLPIPPARTLVLEDGEALVSSFDGPLVSAFDAPGRKVVHVSFDMLAKLFPFRLAFPMLLRNAIAWFEVEEDVVLEASYAPGSTIRPLRRTGADRVRAFFLDAAGELQEREVPVEEGRFYFTETDRTGPIRFRVGSENLETVVNLASTLESRIAPDLPPPGEDGVAIESGRGLFNRDLWAVLALLGLVLWAAEWFTYHRRITE